MGTAAHAATVYNTGTETEQPRERTQARVSVSKKKKTYLVQIGVEEHASHMDSKWEWKRLVKACDPSEEQYYETI